MYEEELHCLAFEQKKTLLTFDIEHWLCFVHCGLGFLAVIEQPSQEMMYE